MISENNIEKFDKYGIHKIYDKWHLLAAEYSDPKFDVFDAKNIDHIIFAGMGGSGVVGDIMESFISKNIHVDIVKGYVLPNTITNQTLIVATSVSGNTEETLTILKNAQTIGAKTIGFSSGGQLEKFCLRNHLHFQKIPKYHSPRASLIVYIFSILNILKQFVNVKKNNIIETLSQLEKTQKEICSQNLTDKNPSLVLAEWIKGIPMIYYPRSLRPVAVQFKNSFQENSKSHAIAEDIVESSHNGIVAWENSCYVQPILIQGKDDYFKTIERWKIVKELFNINKIDYKEVLSVNGSLLNKIVNMLYLLDYTTIYYAIKLGIDPTPVKSIDYIKSRLNY